MFKKKKKGSLHSTSLKESPSRILKTRKHFQGKSSGFDVSLEPTEATAVSKESNTEAGG